VNGNLLPRILTDRTRDGSMAGSLGYQDFLWRGILSWSR